MRMILNSRISRTGLVLLACAAARPRPAAAQDAAPAARRVTDIAAPALSEYPLGVRDGRRISAPDLGEARP